MTRELVLRVTAKLLIPFIVLFALYVQFHGDFGPGGGFQAGVIAAGALVFSALSVGLDARLHSPPPSSPATFCPKSQPVRAGADSSRHAPPPAAPASLPSSTQLLRTAPLARA